MKVSEIRKFCGELKRFEAGGGRVAVDGATMRLTLPPVGDGHYADAQLDNYAHPPKSEFFNRAPMRLTVRARFSHSAMAGTCGFGFWNHPFGLRGEVLAPPCNVWFFNASAHSNLQVLRGSRGYGFKAAMLDSGSWMPRLPGWLLRAANGIANAAMRLPVLPGLMLAGAQRAVCAAERDLDGIDLTAWHEYCIDWCKHEAGFFVDGCEVLRAPKPPGCALGFVAWVDNYRAVAANGNYAFGYVACAEEQWMEIELMGGGY
jgi:hypothetical protein